MPRRKMVKSPILEKAMSPEVLDRAWRDLAQDRAPWSPDLPQREALKLAFTRRLLELREEVLEGRYQPCELREFIVPQPGGRRRLIQAQYLRDKLVQRAIWIVLQPRAEGYFHPHSFAYRPRRTAALARECAQNLVLMGHHWMFYGKIHRFYDHVPQRRLMRQLSAFLKDRPTHQLMEKWLVQSCRMEFEDQGRIGIPRGTVLSPFYLNIYLHQLDMALAKKEILFLRFADQVTLFAKSERELARAERTLYRAVERLGLELTWDSNWVVAGGDDKVFAGENLTELLKKVQENAG